MSNLMTDAPGVSLERRSTGLDAGLLLARIALALPFLYHGSGIAFGAFGGPGLAGFSAFTHLPLLVAALVGYGQFLGGLGILFGVLSRLASAGVGLIMLGAVLVVHLPKGYDVTKGGFEHALALLILALALIATGPGRLTLARFLPLPKKPGTDEPVSALK